MSTIKEKIEKDFKQAYLNKDMFKKNFLSVIRSEVSRGEAGIKTFNDPEMISLLKKMCDSADQIGTEDAVKEKEILQNYLPTMLTKEELKEKALIILAQHSLNSDVNIGIKMGILTKGLTPFKGQYDAKVLMEILKENA